MNSWNDVKPEKGRANQGGDESFSDDLSCLAKRSQVLSS